VVLGDKKVAERAEKIANQRMKEEILPILSRKHPFLASRFQWRPLRTDFAGQSDYGMKLKLPDKLVLEILKDDNLMDMTTKIVIESTTEAATDWEPKAFVTNILDVLMGADG
jgi:hypothetical protein